MYDKNWTKHGHLIFYFILWVDYASQMSPNRTPTIIVNPALFGTVFSELLALVWSCTFFPVFAVITTGGADPTGDRSYPPCYHLAPPGDTGTELSAVESRPAVLFRIYASHHSNEGRVWNIFATVTKSPFAFCLGGRPTSSLTSPPNWRHWLQHFFRSGFNQFTADRLCSDDWCWQHRSVRGADRKFSQQTMVCAWFLLSAVGWQLLRGHQTRLWGNYSFVYTLYIYICIFRHAISITELFFYVAGHISISAGV